MRRKIVFLMVVATTLICANVSYGQNSPAPAASGSPIDATLYTTYTIDSAHTSVTWIVCGSTQNTSGCYASGNLGPFAKVGALILYKDRHHYPGFRYGYRYLIQNRQSASGWWQFGSGVDGSQQ